MSAIEDKTKAQWRDLERSFLEAPDDEDEDSFRARADAVPGALADMKALRLEFDALGNQRAALLRETLQQHAVSASAERKNHLTMKKKDPEKRPASTSRTLKKPKDVPFDPTTLRDELAAYEAINATLDNLAIEVVRPMLGLADASGTVRSCRSFVYANPNASVTPYSLPPISMTNSSRPHPLSTRTSLDT